MRLLVFDNYDSFTFNLVHAVKALGVVPDVFRNDKISLEEIQKYDKIILSPGPGLPQEAGIMKALISEYHQTKSILGVCLGHQAIGEVFGATLRNLDWVYHGVATKAKVIDRDELMFRNLDSEIVIGRYHSWVIDRNGFPHEELQVTAVDENDEIMAIRHKKWNVCGVQFHPESVLTPQGQHMIENWLLND